MFYYDSEAERQFARERIAEMAQDARRIQSASDDRKPSRMRSAMAKFMRRARQRREARAPVRA